MKRISLAITNFNRTDSLLKSFANVLQDERISEVVIVDDCSELRTYDKLRFMIADLYGETELQQKINLYRNHENLGMSRNKARAIEYCKSDYCIIFDSDNVMDTKYLNALYKQNWKPDTIYCPDFAKPQFDYRYFKGRTFSRYNIKPWFRYKTIDCLLNTCNYFVHRESYLKVFQYNPEIKASDTIWFNYLWLKSGKSFYVVPGMEYDHAISEDSGFLKDADYNLKKAEEIKQMILAL